VVAGSGKAVIVIHLIIKLPLPYHQTLCRVLDVEFHGEFCAWFAERHSQEFPYKSSRSLDFHHHYLSEVGYSELWRALKKDRNALVILGGWSSPMTNKTLLMTSVLRAPLFIWADHPHPRRRSRAFAVLRQTYLRLLSATFVSGFLACGKPTVEHLRALGIAGDNLIEFPYWVDVPARWTPPPACVDGESRALQLLAVGRLVPVKQFEVAIRALARVNREADVARLSIVGEGPERKALEELAGALGVADAITFVGWLEADGVQMALQKCDALVLTSKFDAYGVVVLEAMAQGRPVLASDTVIAAVDRDDGSGAIQLHGSGNDELLASQIQCLASDRDRLGHASFAARAVAEQWQPERAASILKQIMLNLNHDAMANPLPKPDANRATRTAG
jgi:glycosyltransferase involved in cell wall biosynthesis